MFELPRIYINCMDKKDSDYIYKQYNDIIENLSLSDEPEAYLMFLRFMEEFISFHNKVDKSNKTIYQVKIIYSKNT